MTRTFTVANIQNVYTTTLLDQFQMLDAQRTFSPIQDVVDASIDVMNKIAEELDRRESLAERLVARRKAGIELVAAQKLLRHNA